MADSLILHNVRISRRGAPLVSIDHTIAPGTVLTVMGPSGVGKSTLLSYVAGTLSPDFEASGKVCLGATDITDLPPAKRRIGILFQDDLLFPHLSVGANLAFGLRPGGTRAHRRQRIESALSDIELEGYADRDPATLSGGQKARVALMRMLLSEPRALLLDEAFSGLDVSLRRQIRALVFDRARRMHLPVLMVTHDQEDAEAAGGAVERLTVANLSA
ncbi:ATP-binding cassette domain-containing protein [Puniceibacterium sediminis]|uniref:Putative thiamine transport system ATP-binding protein n=1 Tax=Puniceibacterium sediminis TaxID=1608407 RepID=A0A238WUU8_9RHOB|nr:ATP-binding cassette domain-containing protein [Puniceibacterium sediminis]SNR50213.1 putative thiamine transport system ATP-binding protein [Puniceibacterium sediminis]